MTVDEYIQADLPFYHITPYANKDQILASGLLARRCGAICVVRSDDYGIWNSIIDTQLTFPEGTRYLIIKLSPRKHSISETDIAQDSISESIAPLHNYIVRKSIPITKEDIIDDMYYSDHNLYYDETDVVGLEEYHIAPIPNRGDWQI